MDAITDPEEGAFDPHSKIDEHPGEGNSPDDRARRGAGICIPQLTRHVMDGYFGGTIGRDEMTEYLAEIQVCTDAAIQADRNIAGSEEVIETLWYGLQAGHYNSSQVAHILERMKANRDADYEAQESLNKLSYGIMKKLLRREKGTENKVIEPSMGTAYTIVKGPFRGFHVSLVAWKTNRSGHMINARVQIFTDSVMVAGNPWHVRVRADQLVAGFLDLDDWDEDEEDVDEDETSGFEGLGSLFG